MTFTQGMCFPLLYQLMFMICYSCVLENQSFFCRFQNLLLMKSIQSLWIQNLVLMMVKLEIRFIFADIEKCMLHFNQSIVFIDLNIDLPCLLCSNVFEIFKIQIWNSSSLFRKLFFIVLWRYKKGFQKYLNSFYSFAVEKLYMVSPFLVAHVGLNNWTDECFQ